MLWNVLIMFLINLSFIRKPTNNNNTHTMSTDLKEKVSVEPQKLKSKHHKSHLKESYLWYGKIANLND